MGIHFNLTEGEPVYKKNIENNSLVYFDKDKTKYWMYGKMGLRDKILRNEIREMDVKNEIIEQIKRFFSFYKSYPSHVDGHMHIRVVPFIAKILANILANIFGIFRVR